MNEPVNTQSGQCSELDTLHAPAPTAPAEPHGAPAPHTLVVGTQHTAQQSGGRGAGVNVEHLNAHGPVYVMAPPAPSLGHNMPAHVGRIHGNPPTLSAAFTGREQTLKDLQALLHTDNAALTPPRAALQGLGGVGKTQTALAYLYQHQHDYTDLFWAIGETPEQLASQLAAFAPTLDPPIPVQADQNATLQQVKQWFATHDNWLLVVDNAENLSKLKAMLPPLNRGRLLLTTRDIAMSSLAKRIELDRLDEDNGALLLLRRAYPDYTDALLADFTLQLQADARAISRDVDGLPLALDQAGAYIEAKQITPARYQELYQHRRETLHHDYDNPDHMAVAVTFDLALKQVEQVPTYGLAAAQLVRLCAFLAPDSIPEEIFTADASELDEPLASLAGDPNTFVDVWAAACRYALLRHDAEPSAFTMHRLAQAVVRDSLSADVQQQMRRQVVKAVSAAFPDVEYPAWPLCQHLLPHALLCHAYVTDHDLRTHEAACLLNKTAMYLQARARYPKAELLYVEALTIVRAMQPSPFAIVAAVCNNLAVLYRHMGRYDEALLLLEEALVLGRSTIGETHPDYATRLDNLAQVYYYQHRYDKAEPLYRQALDITRKALGDRHPDVAIRLNNLANVYTDTQHYAEAEPLFVEAQTIHRATLGEAHPDDVRYISNLGMLYVRKGHYEEAEPRLQQALPLLEHVFGPQHPHVASCHFWLGVLRYQQGDRTMAADHLRQALAIQEGALGLNHPDTVNTRDWLALVEAG